MNKHLFDLKINVVNENMVHEIETETEYVEKVAEYTGHVLVDFYAQWCGPCKRFSGTYERLSKTWTNVNFYKVDVEVEDLKNVVDEEEIEAMPTFVLYSAGREVGRISGADEQRLVSLLEKSLSK